MYKLLCAQTDEVLAVSDCKDFIETMWRVWTRFHRSVWISTGNQ
jgi:hypothetical protein